MKALLIVFQMLKVTRPYIRLCPQGWGLPQLFESHWTEALPKRFARLMVNSTESNTHNCGKEITAYFLLSNLGAS